MASNGAGRLGGTVRGLERKTRGSSAGIVYVVDGPLEDQVNGRGDRRLAEPHRRLIRLDHYKDPFGKRVWVLPIDVVDDLEYGGVLESGLVRQLIETFAEGDTLPGLVGDLFLQLLLRDGDQYRRGIGPGPPLSLLDDRPSDGELLEDGRR